ncbi:hypothetical protein IU447_24035 [Nocardia farcinica]|uniref:DUF6941 family protein n=1 Tax=Nocardia farcinica TaxID=37329 RepID=UPI0018944116|nr:hypothetical protein [Nocardia farcinica]MBF6363190.1 hypothetical protein [Nocardia farcinica]
MKLIAMLADAAQVDSLGKVHILGLGWSSTSTPTSPQAVIIVADLTPEEAQWSNQRTITVRLCGESGEVVQIPRPTSPETTTTVDLRVELDLMPDDDAHVHRLSVAANIGPGIPIPPGRYQWVVTVEGEGGVSESVPFTVRSEKPAA